jgi:hypothetical protein
MNQTAGQGFFLSKLVQDARWSNVPTGLFEAKAGGVDKRQPGPEGFKLELKGEKGRSTKFRASSERSRFGPAVWGGERKRRRSQKIKEAAGGGGGGAERGEKCWWDTRHAPSVQTLSLYIIAGAYSYREYVMAVSCYGLCAFSFAVGVIFSL